MSEAQHPHEALQASVAALRASGAWQRDAARFFTLEALARRLAGQPEAVQRVLRQKLEAGLAEYAAGTEPPAAVAPAKVAVRCAPIAELNEALRAARSSPATGEAAQDPDELRSARHFRQAWGRHRTLDQLDRAVSRKPANAGPLNSHHLVLQSLDMMRSASTDYLRRFIAQVETLQWIEEAVAAAAREQARPKPARKARARK